MKIKLKSDFLHSPHWCKKSDGVTRLYYRCGEVPLLWPRIALFLAIILFMSAFAQAEDRKSSWSKNLELNAAYLEIQELAKQVEQLKEANANLERRISELEEKKAAVIVPIPEAAKPPCKDCDKPAVEDPRTKQVAELKNHQPWYEEPSPGVLLQTSDKHLIDTHHADPELVKHLTASQKNQLHGKYHEELERQKTAAAKPKAATVQVFQQGGCPGGICPTQSWPRRFRR